MKRVGETLCTLAVIGAVGVVKFGMPEDLPSFSASSASAETVDPQTAFNQRWGKPSIRQEVGAYYRDCDAARAAGAAPMRVGEPGYRVNLDRDGDGIACEPYRGR